MAAADLRVPPLFSLHHPHHHLHRFRRGGWGSEGGRSSTLGSFPLVSLVPTEDRTRNGDGSFLPPPFYLYSFDRVSHPSTHPFRMGKGNPPPPSPFFPFRLHQSSSKGKATAPFLHGRHQSLRSAGRRRRERQGRDTKPTRAR